MRESDAAPFVALLRDVFGLYPAARPLTEGQVAMFFRALSEHSLEHVRRALDAHVRDPQRGRFPPVPADVLAQLQADAHDDTRPAADEAWAIALRATDEARTVVWTEEIAQAWAVALPVLGARDQVGARLAFREAYERLVADARAARAPARWFASLGWDEQQRAQAIGQAVQLGYLPREELLALPEPKLALAPPPEVRAKLLDELRDVIAARTEEALIDTTERDALRDRKAELQQRVDAYAAGMAQ
jgi:hypothetical protein